MFDDPRFREPGWVLLPLRAFLGVTFVYAGLYKLADPHYLDAASPLSVHSQMAAAAKISPIGGIVSVAAAHATLFGLLIAFGELAVGLGALLGLWTRLAAAGGMALALSFFLTASWGTTPYFLGPDIYVFFAWTAVLLGGDGGVFSLQTALRRAVRREMRLPAVATRRESPETVTQVERRTLIRTGAVGHALDHRLTDGHRRAAVVPGARGGDHAGVRRPGGQRPAVHRPADRRTRLPAAAQGGGVPCVQRGLHPPGVHGQRGLLRLHLPLPRGGVRQLRKRHQRAGAGPAAAHQRRRGRRPGPPGLTLTLPAA
jgi:uncharacterized membrane protein YphA (DoxX/SURF4 family)